MMDFRIGEMAHTICEINCKLDVENITKSELTKLYHEVLFIHNRAIYIMYCQRTEAEADIAGCLYISTNSLLIKVIELFKLNRGEENEKDNIYSKN